MPESQTPLPPEDTPETSISLHALGHFVRAVERRMPGLMDEWVDSLQDEALLNEIIRLRGPRDAPSVRLARSGALAWAKHVRLVTLAHFGLSARDRLTRAPSDDPMPPRPLTRRRRG